MSKSQVWDTKNVEKSSFRHEKCRKLGFYTKSVEKLGFRSDTLFLIKKHIFAGTDDLEIRPFTGPPGGRKRTREVKSIWIDPARAPERPLEPSYGRFSEESGQKP